MNTVTVLIVDDDPFSLEAMDRILNSDRYQIVTAMSGAEALGVIKSPAGQAIRLLLLDVSLTDMSGFTLADQAKVVIPDAKVIYVSGYSATPEHRHRWIEKPIWDLDALQRRVLGELFGG
jgi:CheY-like chemotaxis protein